MLQLVGFCASSLTSLTRLHKLLQYTGRAELTLPVNSQLQWVLEFFTLGGAKALSFSLKSDSWEILKQKRHRAAGFHAARLLTGSCRVLLLGDRYDTRQQRLII